MNALQKMQENGILIDSKDIYEIVNKYNIKELSVFGSVIRTDFTKNSDIDFLVVFNNPDEISLLDLVDIKIFFEKITHRKVDIVEPESLKNPFRKKAILDNKEIIYAA